MTWYLANDNFRKWSQVAKNFIKPKKILQKIKAIFFTLSMFFLDKVDQNTPINRWKFRWNCELSAADIRNLETGDISYPLKPVKQAIERI